MKLSDLASGRENNYNLIRMSAALAVLLSHSFPLATGRSNTEPFRQALGITPGDVAVDIFFIISGFLVTASLLQTRSTKVFLWHRFLRIYPALVVMLLMTVFEFGLFFTTLPWKEYLTNRAVYSYFFHCATLIHGVLWTLPGVFVHNPYGAVVNGSLWSLPWEVLMYVILAGMFLGLRLFKASGFRVFRVVIILCALVFGGIYLYERLFLGESSVMSRCSFMFFTGASYFILRGRITLSPWLFWGVLATLLLEVWNKQAFFVLYAGTLAYLVMYLAYIPSGMIRQYNRLGDYSYGVYIYAFPVQQALAALIPGISIFSMILFSSLGTLSLAVLSWHLLEKHALALKTRYLGSTRPHASFANRCTCRRLERFKKRCGQVID